MHNVIKIPQSVSLYYISSF